MCEPNVLVDARPLGATVRLRVWLPNAEVDAIPLGAIVGATEPEAGNVLIGVIEIGPKPSIVVYLRMQ